MIIPAAERDLDVARTQIRADQITSDEARVTERRIAVTVALLGREAESRIHAGVVHHLARAGIEILHLVKVRTPNSAGLERLEQGIATRENILAVRVRKIRKTVVAGSHIKWRKTARQITLTNKTARAVERNKGRQ